MCRNIELIAFSAYDRLGAPQSAKIKRLSASGIRSYGRMLAVHRENTPVKPPAV